MIKLRITGLEELRKTLSPEKFDEVCDALLERTAKVLCDEVANLSPVRTGRLMASWAYVKISAAEYVVGSTVEYAPYVAFGTRPHVIYPVRAKALRFEVDGEVVYAKYVHHPGTQPNPFIFDAIRLVRNRFKSFARNIIKNLLGGE
ncbi:MAG: HK97 gp10 family phage protein [Nitrososphaerota archaeon]